MTPDLFVNVDHIATLRQARRGLSPCPLQAAKIVLEAGAKGITVHLREDRRHIQDRDVLALIQAHPQQITLEMAPTAEMLGIALKLKPKQVTLVPELRRELTTESGLNLLAQTEELKAHTARLREAGIGVSLFLDPDPRQLELLSVIEPTAVELHTGKFASDFEKPEAREKALLELSVAGKLIQDHKLKLNAGHGLDALNLPALLGSVEGIAELHIGFALVARAVFVGLREATQETLRSMTAVEVTL